MPSTSRVAPPTLAELTNDSAWKQLLLLLYIMPTDVSIDVNRKLVITVCSGTVTDEEFGQAREKLLAHPAFDASFDRLWDFSAVTKEEVSPEVLASLVKTSPFVGDISRAVVVSLSPKAVGRIMEFISASRRFNRRIAAFPTLESAEQWIESRAPAARTAAGTYPLGRGSLSSKRLS